MPISSSHPTKPLLLCAVLAITTAPVIAASDFEHGLYLGFETLPTEYGVELGPFSGEEEFDSAFRFNFGYRGRSPQNIAFAIQTGLAISREEIEDVSLSGFGFFAEPGISFRVADGFTVDLLASFGIGISTIDDESSGLDENGSYADIGIIAQPGYRWPGGFRLAGRLGLLARSQTWDTNSSIIDELTFDSSGAIIGLQIGYAF